MKTEREEKRAKASRSAIALTVVSLVAAAIQPALAHHSFGMFDSSKVLVLEGTIKEFQWTNPHIWIHVVSKKPGATAQEWAIEGASLNALVRMGWTRSSLKPGDKVVARINPLRTGERGGSLVSISVNGVMVGKARS